MGFTGQEYWSGLPCQPPGDLPDPGIEPASVTLQAISLLLDHWKAQVLTENLGKEHLQTTYSLKQKVCGQ